jgi:hypothetical protein
LDFVPYCRFQTEVEVRYFIEFRIYNFIFTITVLDTEHHSWRANQSELKSILISTSSRADLTLLWKEAEGGVECRGRIPDLESSATNSKIKLNSRNQQLRRILRLKFNISYHTACSLLIIQNEKQMHADFILKSVRRQTFKVFVRIQRLILLYCKMLFITQNK